MWLLDQVINSAGVMGTDTPVLANLEHIKLSYVLLLSMIVVPQYMLIHPYLHLLIIAPLLVWIGSQRALIEAQKAPEDSQVSHHM